LNESNVQERFAETRDTLCYATNDNQSAVYGLLQQEADLAIVVGGFNSSNTSHLVELCEEKLPTYYIDHPDRINSKETIEHFDFHKKIELNTTDYLPNKQPIRILMTSGASCPDALVEKTIEKIAGYFMPDDEVKTYLQSF
jgi:4-hydroxy-3-methylbut-2-enyl diphosphate reductase